MRKYYKFKMDILLANVLSILLTILAFIPAKDLLLDAKKNTHDVKILGIFFIAYLGWMFLHEALHGLGHILCGAKTSDFTYGAALEKGVLFCLIRKEVNKKDILVSLLFPFFFIGVVTYIIGMIINSPFLVLLSALNIGGACMDLTMFIHFIKLGNDITYIEPGDGTSFYLMSNKPIKKLFGLNLVEEGEYKKDMFSNEKYKKFDISKTSMILGIIMAICCLILIFL